MKKLLYILCAVLVAGPAVAASRADIQDNAKNGARSTIGVRYEPARKSSLKFDYVAPAVTNPVVTTENADPVDNRDAERAACLSNNVGMDATFVWASRYSNTASYATMVEDVENPENNVCFAHVKIASSDSGINLSDFDSKYFPVDEVVTCGNWINKEKLENRILDAKKTARTLATIGGAVGGAGIGVGAMELFGNELIGGAVQGQKALDGDELFISQLKVLRDDDKTKYESIKKTLKQLKELCDANPSISDCKTVKYNNILTALGEK